MSEQTFTPTRRAMLAASAAAGVGLGLHRQAAKADDNAIRPFRIDVPQGELDDLRRRIQATRWPDRETAPDRMQGAQLAKLQGLAAHWGADYDWRRVEAELNALPQFITEIDGVDIHFIHVRSRHADAMPLVMTHGWPGSVLELLETIGPLTDPTAHGGRPEDAFDLLLPSLPGFGFSGKPTDLGWSPDRVALAWAQLMQRLGYERYVAQGGDWGSPVSTAMARQAAPGLLGVHVNLPATVPAEIDAALASGGPPPPDLSQQERAVFDALAVFRRSGGSAYNTMMTARPQAVGYGATDSPVGLAAWLLVHPGFDQWMYGEDPEQTPSRDQVLDNLTLYWLTNTAASSARIYWENGGRSAISATAQRTAEVALPVAVTVFPHDIYRAPESWARRAYPNLIYFNEVDRGGHFAAWEEPLIFTSELRSAFRPLRG